MKPDKLISEIDFQKSPNLKFLKRLTNDTGIIQHTKYAVPDRNLGYSVDDNARGLLVVSLYYKLFGSEDALELGIVYLSFVQHAKTKDNWFYNFLTFDNRFLDHAKTEDGFGRCFWALGYTIFANPRRDLVQGSQSLINEIKDNLQNLGSPRAKCYCLAGLYYLSEADPDEKLWQTESKRLADDLVLLYERKNKGNWHWFEDYLTYANGIFPYALLLAYQTSGQERYLEVALEALTFLETETRTTAGIPSPIGQDGWYFKGKSKAVYDQQPVEAAKMVIANTAAFKVTFDKKYLLAAKEWFAWYFGYNIKKIEVFDTVTQGCFDAITPHGVNLNQGAESILTYLLAYQALSDVYLKLDIDS